VWRDYQHISPAAARHVRDGIWARIQATGLLADHPPQQDSS
jgi:hypothetical protein